MLRMTPRARICLITPGHLSSTPRLVKEADALHGAGYHVRVVAADHYAPARALDATILKRAPWHVDQVGLGSRLTYLAQRGMQLLARRRIARSAAASPRLALWAHNPQILRLARAAAREPADLFLGHCLAGLAAAGHAATARRARLGFDAEDFHRNETSDTAAPEVVALETRWIPRCRHLTAASPLIAAAYAAACQVPPPAVVLNVFPLVEAPLQPVSVAPAATPATLYWFSQTIGPGRGLEAMVEVLGRMKTPVQLHLRGASAPGYRAALQAVAARSGLRPPLVWHAPAAPHLMVQLAASFHAGLSSEQITPRNRALCLTNKIFTSLVAGSPVVLTDTPAQRALAADLSDAAVLIDVRESAAAATTLDGFFGAPERLTQARAHAWRLGRDRYNWEREQVTFLSCVRAAVPPQPPPTRALP